MTAAICPTRFRTTALSTLATFALLLHQTADARADTMTFGCAKDNTLIESAAGEWSNGASDGVFSGRLGTAGGGLKLRGLMAFNLAAIPPGSTINSVSLRLVLVQGHGGTQTVSLHHVLADWGEGTSYNFAGYGAPSKPNDATWLHRFYPNVFWTTPGGQFVATASASASVGNTGSTTWSGTGLVADVQGWVANPSTNFGWLIKANEVAQATAKKFTSKDWVNNPDVPLLTITFTPPPPPVCNEDVNHDGSINVTDMLEVINSWGACSPPPQACPTDIAPALQGNGAVDVNDLLAIINAWGPCL